MFIPVRDGHIVHDYWQACGIRYGVVVAHKAALVRFVVIGCHQQQRICTALLCLQ